MQRLFIIVLLCVLLCGLGLSLVRPRPVYTVDALNYFAMAAGSWEHVTQPYRHRVVIPFLIGLLPVSAPRGFLIFTYCSLVGTYFLGFLICRKAGLSLSSSLLAITATLAARTHLYNYYNPFLTDAPGLFATTLLFFAYQMDLVFLFAFAFVGVVIRESVSFIVPAWFLGKNWKVGLMIGCIALGFLEGSTLLHPTSQPYASSFIKTGILTLHNPLPMMEGALLSWSALWVLGIAGIMFMSAERLRQIAVPGGLLLLGAFVSCFVSGDRERMFGVLYPLMVLMVAQTFEKLLETRPNVISILFAALTLQIVLGNPYVLQGWHRRSVIVASNALALLITSALLWLVTIPSKQPPQ